jgi:dolichol-phosphate mannosyltransferase
VWLGFTLAALSLAFAVLMLIAQFTGAYSAWGWASIFVGALFLGGFQLLSVGVIVEYTGRIYDEVKRRPLYIISQTSGTEG